MMYDNRIGRWFTTDPLEGKFSSFSPYNFVLNNPILLIDPDGNEPIKPKVIGLKSYIKLIISRQVIGLSSLKEQYPKYKESKAVSGGGDKR
jgi:hypothetical protein